MRKILSSSKSLSDGSGDVLVRGVGEEGEDLILGEVWTCVLAARRKKATKGRWAHEEEEEGTRVRGKEGETYLMTVKKLTRYDQNGSVLVTRTDDDEPSP